MRDYTVQIEMTSFENLSAREKIMLKDTSDAKKLDEIVENEPIIITPTNYAVLNIHNEQSENKDYVVYVIFTADGKFTTSSENFFISFRDIWDEMDGEEFSLKIYKLDSKNYKGKKFLTCSIC